MHAFLTKQWHNSYYISEKLNSSNLLVYKVSYSKYGFGSLKFLLFLCKNPILKCEFSPTVTPRDGNCLLHAIMDGVLNNEGFRHTDGGTDEWTVLLKDLKCYDNTMDEV